MRVFAFRSLIANNPIPDARTSREFSSNLKMNPTGSCWRLKSPRMMDTRNNKVPPPTRVASHVQERTTWLTLVRSPARNFDRLDRAQWHGYGIELSGSGGVRGHLVSSISAIAFGFSFLSFILALCSSFLEPRTDPTRRNFVSNVQQHLLSLATAGEGPRALFPALAFRC